MVDLILIEKHLNIWKAVKNKIGEPLTDNEIVLLDSYWIASSDDDILMLPWLFSQIIDVLLDHDEDGCKLDDEP